MKETKKHIPEYAFFLIMLGALLALIMLAVLPNQEVPYRSNAIEIGSVKIAWYAVFILSGIIAASMMALKEFKRTGLNPDALYDALIIIVPLAILGARLYYVLFDPSGSYHNVIDVINLTDGGLAIHGGIIVAAIGAYVFSRVKKIDFWHLADIVAPGLLIGQIFGRWGNFMNQEAYGSAMNGSWLENLLPGFIKDQMTIDGVLHHPTFLYESLLNMIVLVILLVLRRKRVLKTGDMLAIYLFGYGLIRGLIIEPMRQDQLMFFNTGIPVNILLSLVMLSGGGLLIFFLKRIYQKELPYYMDLTVEDLND